MVAFNGLLLYSLHRFFSLSKAYDSIGLEGGGMQLKICICKHKRKEHMIYVSSSWGYLDKHFSRSGGTNSTHSPFTAWFLSHIVSSVFVKKELFVWLFNKLHWKARQVITQQRTGLGVFFSFKVI